MTVTISINEDSTKFTGMDMKKLAIVIGAVSQPPMFYNYTRREFAGVGEVGTNNKILAVSSAFPLSFEDHDFTLMGSLDPYHASRTLSLLIDFMRKDLIKVHHDGAAMTPEDVLTFEAAL